MKLTLASSLAFLVLAYLGRSEGKPLFRAKENGSHGGGNDIHGSDPDAEEAGEFETLPSEFDLGDIPLSNVRSAAEQDLEDFEDTEEVHEAEDQNEEESQVDDSSSSDIDQHEVEWVDAQDEGDVEIQEVENEDVEAQDSIWEDSDSDSAVTTDELN